MAVMIIIVAVNFEVLECAYKGTLVQTNNKGKCISTRVSLASSLLTRTDKWERHHGQSKRSISGKMSLQVSTDSFSLNFSDKGVPYAPEMEIGYSGKGKGKLVSTAANLQEGETISHV